MKYLIWVLFFLFLAIFLTDFCHKQTKGFIQGKIALSFSENLPERGNLEEALMVLDQPFTYLRKGNSAFVLVSSDQKYVLKFLRTSHINPPFWVKLKPVQTFFETYCVCFIDKKERTKKELIKSYTIASTLLESQTGILYSHFSHTTHLKKKIIFYDPIKVKHTIAADLVCFTLQKKAEPFCPYFKQLDREGKLLLLQEFAALLLERAQKGIYDKDVSPEYNLGILEGHLMTFDLDSLKLRPTAKEHKEKESLMLQEGKKMIRWLKSLDPELSFFLENEIEKLSRLS